MFDAEPAGWEQTMLGAIATLGGGTTPSKSEQGYWGDGAIPWATPSDITSLPRGTARISATEVAVTDRALKECSLPLNPPGTVLMTSRATIGYAALNDVPMATNQGFITFRCGDRADPEFLLHWLTAKRDFLVAAAGGSTFKELSRGTAKLLPILLPPLHEQRRIAEVLRSVDEAASAAQREADAAAQVFRCVRDELIANAGGEFDEIPVADALAKNRGEKVRKLQTSGYKVQGAYPIVDQGADFICGYTDDADAVWPYSLPVIVFGDHTLALKFVDFPFVIGADGTQCLTPKEGILPRYLYYAIQSLDLSSEGYARHFKLLKEKAIPLPDERSQQDIIDVLIELERSHENALGCVRRTARLKRAITDDLLSGRVRVPA